MARTSHLIGYTYREEIDWVPNPNPLYKRGDAVFDNGTTYIYFNANPSAAATSNTAFWVPAAERGDKGDPGQSSGLVTQPLITPIGNVLVGEPQVLQVGGSSVLNADASIVITTYEWEIRGQLLIGSPLPYTFTGEIQGESLPVKARAVDSAGNRSAWSSVNAVLSINTPPDVSGFSLAAPTFFAKGSTDTITASGVSDNESSVTYRLVNLVNCTANVLESTGAFELTASSTATQMSFAIEAVDAFDVAVSCGSFTKVINHPPVVTNVTHNLPALLSPGVSYTAALSGATDPNNDALTYTVSDLVNCTVTPLSGTGAITVVPGSSGITAGFTVTVADARNVTSGTKTFTVPVNLGPVGTNITSSVLARYNKGTTNNVSFAGATDPNDDALTYTISSATNCTFAKTSGIAANELVAMTIANTSVTSFSFRVTPVDSNGVSGSYKDLSGVINQPPVATNIVATPPSLMNAGTTASVTISGATDLNSDTLTYSIGSLVNCSFSKTTGIAVSEAVTLTAGAGAEDGSYRVTVTDPYGLTAYKDFSFGVNVAPAATSVAVNYPSSMQRNGSYSLALSGATDGDGNFSAYEIVSTVGCSTNVSSTASAFTLTVSPTASSVSITVRVKDTNNLYSGNKTLTFSGTLTYATGDVTTSAGSTQAITINPGFAGTVTVIGNGGGGTAAVPYIAPTTCSGGTYFATGAAGMNTFGYPCGTAIEQPRDEYGNIIGQKYCNGSSGWVVANPGGCFTYGEGQVNGSMINLWRYYAGPTGGQTAVAGTAGTASTVSGAISTSFSGATTGVVAAPGAETRYFNLSAGSTHNLSVYAAPSGGSVRVLW